MGVYKRKLAKGLRYFFSGQYRDQKYFSRAIYLTRAECLIDERKKLAEMERNLNNPQNDMMLMAIMSMRLDEMKANQSNRYYAQTQSYYKMLLKHVGDVPVADVKKAQINLILLEYSKHLKEKGRTNHCANAMLRAYKALFNYAIRIYDIEMRNPCVGIKLFPVDIKLKHIPTEKEISLVRNNLGKEEKFLFDFVKQTCCRINEALRLKYEDIQDGLVTLWTRKAKNSNLTPRRIPIPQCLIGEKGKGRIFIRWDKIPGFIENRVDDIGGKRWNWHNLRHRRASLWAKEGKTLLEIMQLLGHSNLSTTQKYLQILGYIKL